MKASTYYFGDTKTQATLLQDRIQSVNSAITSQHLASGGYPMIKPAGLIDAGAALNRMHRRAAKFYGLASKYDGKGNRRNPA